jgi:small neutral amino acid transporter SnatA (MarC family)
MWSFGLLLAGFLATTNAGRVALARERWRPRPGSVAAALAAGVALVVVAVVFADDVLDALSISPESFRIAAGIVLAVTAVRTLLWPAASAGPFAAVLITPELACLALSFGADEPLARTLGAAAASLAVAAIAAAARLPIPAALTAQLLAALQVVVAVALAISGMRDV